MADEKILITVDVDTQKMQNELSGAIHVVQAMKEEQKRLNKEITSGNDTNGEYARQLVQVTTRLQEAQRQVKSQTAIMQAATAAGIKQNASLDEQRQYLGVLQKAYANLSGEAKELADQEGGMRDQIKALNDSLFEQEHAIGQNSRNVGNYTESILKAIPGVGGLMHKLDGLKAVSGTLGKVGESGFKGMASGIGTATKAAMKFIATPIGAAIAAIAVVLKVLSAGLDKLKEAFNKSDEAGTNLSKMMAVFTPIINGVSKAFDALANGLGVVMGKIADFCAGLSDAVDASVKLVEAQDALEDKEREYTESSAKNSRDIARLREEAATSKDLDERKKKLEEAIALEKQNLADNLAVQKEKLRILEETAKAESDTSDETKNKIAAARAAMYQAEESYYLGVKKMEKELAGVEQIRIKEEEDKQKEAEARARENAQKRKAAAEKARSAAKSRAEALAAEVEEIQKRELAGLELKEYEYNKAMEKELKIAGLTEEQKEKIRKYYADKLAEDRKKEEEEKKLAEEEEKRQTEEKEKAKLEAIKKAREEFGLDPEKSPEEQELEALQLARENDLLNAEEYELAKTMIQKKYSEEREEKTKQEVDAATAAYKEACKQTTSQSAAALTALSSLFGEFAESSEAAAAAQKAFAFGSILINQAMSIAEGAKAIAAAMAGAAEAAAATGPAAPFTLMAYQAQMVGQVLAVVASVASTIVQAKQVFSQSSAGSYERGGIIPGNSYTGDKLTANVNSREMVLTQGQQARLFDIANGGQTSFAYEAMTSAIVAGMAAAPAPQLALTELADAQNRVTTYNEIAAI